MEKMKLHTIPINFQCVAVKFVKFYNQLSFHFWFWNFRKFSILNGNWYVTFKNFSMYCCIKIHILRFVHLILEVTVILKWSLTSNCNFSGYLTTYHFWYGMFLFNNVCHILIFHLYYYTNPTFTFYLTKLTSVYFILPITIDFYNKHWLFI